MKKELRLEYIRNKVMIMSEYVLENQIIDTIFKIIEKVSGVELDSESLNLSFSQLGIDSLDMFKIIFFVEDEFNIEFKYETIYGFDNLQDLVDEIENIKNIKYIVT